MKKRVLSLLLALCMVLCLAPTAAFAAGNDGLTGAGTESDPYLLSTAEALHTFCDIVNGSNGRQQNGVACAKLTADIVLNDGTFDENGNWSESGTSDRWTPIGDISNPYAGTFDGDGHTIRGLYVKGAGNAGLFGYINQGTVKNVTVTGYVEGTLHVGGIVGYGSRTTVTGCTNAATVKGGFSHVGGIVGWLFYEGNVRNCANLGSVRAQIDSERENAYVGGIAGHVNISATIADCYNAGSIAIQDSGTGKYTGSCLGGIIGKVTVLDLCYISNCYSVGSLTYRGSASAEIYGIAGDATGCAISNCYWLEGTAESGVGGNPYQTTDITAHTKAEFADGTVLALLKGDRTDSPWADKCQYNNTAGKMLPVLSWQVARATDYHISVVDKDGKKVPIHSLNCDNVLGDGTVRFQYDEANQKGILTLDGADLASEESFPINADQIDDLEIVLKGKNRIRSDTMAGIVACNLTFSGDGSLDISSAGRYNWMVDCTGNFTVNGANVKITSVDYALFVDGTPTVSSGTLELISTGTGGVALDCGFSAPNFVLGDDRIMITGRAADGSDAKVTDPSLGIAELKSARYIKIFNKYVPITYAPGAYGGEQAYQKNKVYGTAFTLDNQHFTRTGYRQTGWAVTDGGDVAYTFGGTYDGNTALTLYPVWQAVPYRVQYDLAGGTVTGNPDQYTVESDSFTLANPQRDGYAFAGWSGTDLTGTANLSVLVPQGSTGDRSYTANWRDITAPAVDGLVDGKVYCGAVEFTATDNDGAVTVTVNGTPLQGENGRFTLAPAQGRQKVIVSDATGNTTEFAVTVNDGHTLEWQSENGQYWQKCKFCGRETDKQNIPAVTISGMDRVCRTQDYTFTFTLPEGATGATYGYEFVGFGDSPLTPAFSNGVYSGVIPAHAYAAEENGFKVTVRAQTADGFAFTAEKTVTIENTHTGGIATCKDKAICEICGESYGDVDVHNHTDLQHCPGKAATQAEAGNREYWYCSGCDKCFADKDGNKEITKADTVTAKLPAETKPATTKPATTKSTTKKAAAVKSPRTGAGAAQGALLLTSMAGAGVLLLGCKKKKYREN